MGARFRCLGPDGREIEIATTDELVRAFKSGTLPQDTLLYDAYGGGWAPARSHSALLGVELPAAPLRAAPEPSRTQPPQEHAPQSDAARGPDPSTRLGAPRAGSPQPPAPRPNPTAAADPAAAWTPRLPAPAAPPPRPVWVVGLPEEEGSADREAVVPAWRARVRRVASLVGPAGAGAVGLLFVVLILLFAQSPASGGKGAVRPVSAAGPDADDSPLVEGEALEDMVGEMERRQAAFGVDRVPSAWLEGIYLAEAGRYPDVQRFWDGYREYVREMKALEGELFRESLTERLAERGLAESQMAMQLARALNDFRDHEPRRAEVYDAMLELADAATALHEMLLEHEDEISYVPGAPGSVRDPIAEAVPTDRDVRSDLNRRLDRVFDALEATQGSRVVAREELPHALRRSLTSNARTSMR